MSALTPTAGKDWLKVTKDPRLGIVAATAKCWAPDLATAISAAALDIGIAIPEWNPRQITSRDAGDRGGFDVLVNYDGHPDPDSADGSYYEVEGATSDDPIETHWNLDVIISAYGPITKDSGGHIHFPQNITDKGTGKQARNKMFGVQAWPNPGLIWNHNWVSPKLDLSIVQTLGTIVAPPGNPPQLSGNRDWLCVRVRGRQRGNVWQMQTSYQMSNPGGSVPEMYRRS